MRDADTYVVYTIDFFDTLACRLLFHGRHVAWGVAADLERAGLWSGDPRAFEGMRTAAEKTCTSLAQGREIAIEDIYRELARTTGWTAEDVLRAARIEADVELRALRPIASNVRRLADLKAQKHRTAILSDFYMDGRFMRQAAETVGALPFVDDIFVSRDSDATKHSGMAFPRLVKTLGVPAGRIQHRGDNPSSDVANARRFGIHAIHDTQSLPTRHEQLLFDQAGGLIAGSVVAGAARAARLSHRAENAREATIARIGANVAGPALSLFVIGLLAEARARGLKRLLFFARDGQILLRIARIFAPAIAPEITLQYCFASRQALFLPAAAGSRTFLSGWFARNIVNNTLHDVMARVALAGDADRAAIEEIFGRRFDWSQVLTPRDEPWIDALLDHPRFREMVDQRSAEARVQLMGYLEQEGMLNEAALGVVDLGWAGRLQLALIEILKAEGRTDILDRLTGFYFNIYNQETAARPDFWCAYHSTNLCIDLFETFCLADHGTTKGYTWMAEGRWAPAVDEGTARAALAWGVEVQQALIVHFATTLRDAWALAPSLTADRLWADMKEAVFKLQDDLVSMPDKDVAEVYGSFTAYGRDQIHHRLTEIAPRLDWFGAPPGTSLRQLLTSTWKVGVLRRSLPDPLFRAFHAARTNLRSLKR